MICATCGASNEPGRKFCGECASSLALICSSCGSANTPSARFCGECASPLVAGAVPRPALSVTPGPGHAAPAAQLPAERKLVSVLFADLVGFTPFAEGRDAEEVRETLGRYFEVASDVIGRYGGTVEKFIGDAVMAVWGTPVAHEDDAERAVRAGLELVDAVQSLGPAIRARCAVLTGEAAVTVGATNQGLVAGDLVNTAARLQSVAEPGTVLVGEATQRAAAKAIAFEDAGERALKGKTAPVPAWRALRVVAERGGRNRAETLEAPFVGRDGELRLLKDLFHATERDRRVRLVSVMGPAGIGKTRLAWEFLKYIDGLVEPVWWHDGRSPAYGEGITFWALGEMVRGRCGLLETDDEATTRTKIAEVVERFVPDPDERRWIGPALLALLGLESGADSQQLFAAWRTFFERLATAAPVVMVFEDFHFADAGLLDFVDHLLDWSRGVPICVVTLARPELLERRPAWGAAKRDFVSLSLEPLPEAAMRELLAGLVPGLPRSAVRTIVERADGMPLYAVETVRMLVAKGRLRLEGETYVPNGDLAEIAVPETLTALIESRLDALGPEDRALLQDAAVLGQSFTLAGLAAVSGVEAAQLEPRLRALVRRELLTLEANPRSPEQGQFAFVQALIREVAYNTLAKRERKRRHLAAARFFESLGSGELAGALAGQYLAAHRNASEGPEAAAIGGQARIALKAAAERAIALGSLGQAVTFLDQAREIADASDEQTELLERAGVAASDGGMPDLAERRLREALERRRASADPGGIARTTALLGESLVTNLKTEAAIALLEPAVAELIGDSAPADADQVALLAQLSRARFLDDDHQMAMALADRALEVGERLDLATLVADLLVTRGSALAMAGRPYEGTGVLRAGLELADLHGIVQTSIRARINLGVQQIDVDPRAALSSAREALALAVRLGRRAPVRTLVANVASAAHEIGEWEVAEREIRTARADDPDEFGRNFLDWAGLTYRSMRGEDTSAEVERLARWAESFDEEAARDAVCDIRAELAFGRGRFADSPELWSRYAASDVLNASRAYRLAVVAALLAGDLAAAERAQARHEALVAHSHLLTLDRRFLHAGVDLFAGRPPEAPIRDLREVAAGYDDLGLRWRRALLGAVAVSVADPARPDVRALGEVALDVVRDLRVPALADVLERRLEVVSDAQAPRLSVAPRTGRSVPGEVSPSASVEASRTALD